MQRDEYLRAVRDDAAHLTDSAQRGLQAPVPSCPEWVVGDLVRHLGEVFEFVTDVVATRAFDEEQEVEPLHDRHLTMRKQRSDGFALSPELLPWFQHTTERLVEVLGEASPDESVWSWWKPEQRAGFWQRRMAHETAVHRWDGQSAHHETSPITNSLALDGVDEALTVHAPERQSECDLPAEGETFRFVTSDGNGSWWVRLDQDGLDVRREGGGAAVTVRGSASDLELFLWQRVPASALDVDGDARLLDRWFELVPPE